MGTEIVTAVGVLHLDLHVLAYQVSMVSAAK